MIRLTSNLFYRWKFRPKIITQIFEYRCDFWIERYEILYEFASKFNIDEKKRPQAHIFESRLDFLGATKIELDKIIARIRLL